MLERITATKAQRAALLDEFERSGLKGEPFAHVASVNYKTFASWIQKRRARSDYAPGVGTEFSERRAIKPVQSLRLLEAVMARPTGTSAPEAPPNHQVLEVLLPGGAKLLIADAPQLALAAQLIATLAKPC